MRERITDQLNEWISESLAEDGYANISIPPGIASLLKRPAIREFAMESLISVRKNVTGSMADVVAYLYILLNLKNDSVRKFKSPVWHRRVRGIYELYMMRQRDYEGAIMKHTNSSNEYVRMEAQTAVIGFLGYKGLDFLDTLTYPLSEWQQLKLLEQLETLDMQDIPQLSAWLVSENAYVVQFALKLADIFQQMQVHDQVAFCLSNPKVKIRYQAIKTLGRIANDRTSKLLQQIYEAEEVENRREILQQIAVIGGMDDEQFLLDRLYETDDKLKLAAGRALVSIKGRDGVVKIESLLQDNERLETGRIESILRQIKFETA